MTYSRVDLEALAWTLVLEAQTSRKRGDWRRRLTSLVRWRSSQLQLAPAHRLELHREVARVLSTISSAPPPTFSSS